MSCLDLKTRTKVDFTNVKRTTSFFDERMSLIPCVAVHSKYLNWFGFSLQGFCLTWAGQGLLLTVSQMYRTLDSELLFIGLNGGAHSVVVFSILYFSLNDHFPSNKARIMFTVMMNFGFAVLNFTFLTFLHSVICFIMVLIQFLFCLSNCILLLLAYIEPHQYSAHQQNQYVKVSSNVQHSNRNLKRLVAGTLAVFVIMFSVLAGINIVQSELEMFTRIELAGEYVFHFSFLLPAMSWAGLLVNHRFNLALAAVTALIVIPPFTLLDAMIYYQKKDVVYCATYLAITAASISFGTSSALLRRSLVRANVPQGNVAWGRR